MKWITNQLTPDNYLIQDGDRIVGSILKQGGFWNVEILNAGAGGDLTFQGHDYAQALAFAAGVEQAWNKRAKP
jgi:hypothetical protein